MQRLATAVLAAALPAVLISALPGAAHAFCGFYVSGAGADLFNNATQVVLMREGTRTVLSMQNNYQGPPQDFAMVVRAASCSRACTCAMAKVRWGMI